ncbi:MAG: four helix bundle protein [Candidatus Omnitrophota bacterium]|nr:four helix bundle protein [Candidatus Omnitrophota bacterium]
MKEFMFDFERLDVYQKSLGLVDSMFSVYRGLDTEHKYSIGSNLIRAAFSVPNNIAEGNDRKYDKEKVRYLDIASGSARECISVITVLKRQKLIKDELYCELRELVREITSMLQGLTASIEKRQRK